MILGGSRLFFVPWSLIRGSQVVLAIDLLLVIRVSQYADPLALLVPADAGKDGQHVHPPHGKSTVRLQCRQSL